MKNKSGKWLQKTPALLIVVSIFYSTSVLAQLTSGNPFSGTRIEIKSGTGVLLKQVPLGLNNSGILVIKAGEFGFSNVFNLKYTLSSHFSIGYQFDYMGIPGNASGYTENNYKATRVRSTMFGNSINIDYYFKNTYRSNYKVNYYINYKLGAVSLTLSDKDKVNETLNQIISISDVGVGVLSGLGLGVCVILNERLGFTGKLEYNRISNSIGDIYNPHKMFTETPYMVSNYYVGTLGLSYKLFDKHGAEAIKKGSSGKFKSKRKTKEYLPYSRKKKYPYKQSHIPLTQ